MDGQGQLTLRCHDGTFFSMPAADAAMLPLAHSTAEEMAAYLWHRIVEGFGPRALRQRGVRSMEVRPHVLAKALTGTAATCIMGIALENGSLLFF